MIKTSLGCKNSIKCRTFASHKLLEKHVSFHNEAKLTWIHSAIYAQTVLKVKLPPRLGSASLSLVGTPRCGVRTAQRAVPTFKYYLRLRARTTVTKNTELNFASCHCGWKKFAPLLPRH
jgi:hypothetical protein